MGGVSSPGFQLFKKLFKEGFEAARKHSDEIISESFLSSSFPLSLSPLTLPTRLFSPSSHRRTHAVQFVRLPFPFRPFLPVSSRLNPIFFPLTDSKLPCFLAFGDQTAQHLRERFQLGFTHQAVDDHLERLIVSSIGSHWTRLYDSVSLHRVFSLLFLLPSLICPLSPARYSSNTTPRVCSCRFSFSSLPLPPLRICSSRLHRLVFFLLARSFLRSSLFVISFSLHFFVLGVPTYTQCFSG